MTNRNVNVWFGSRPMVERGPFDELSSTWDGRVSYILTGSTRGERVDLGWDKSPIPSRIDVVDLSAYRSARGVEGLDDINIFAGLHGTVRPHLENHLGGDSAIGPIVFSERPGAYGPFWTKLGRRLAIPLRQRLAAHRLAEKCSLILPLGGLGVDAFSRHGWNQVPKAPFIYCPPEVPIGRRPDSSDSETKHFVYVGRTTRFTKGLHVLLEAVRQLPKHGWRLSIIGGHGEMASEAAHLANSDSRVTYYGPLSTGSMIEILGGADACVVPSVFDGWNVTVNYALQLGVGVIASDQAVSHELISASGAGVVSSAGDSVQLAHEMMQVLLHPSLSSDWSQRALRFRAQISPTTVSKYLAGCLLFATGEASSLPKPPWET